MVAMASRSVVSSSRWVVALVVLWAAIAWAGDAPADYDLIPHLRWAGPGEPDTYEAYRSTRVAKPLEIERVAMAVRPLGMAPMAAATDRVLVIVNSTLLPNIQDRVNQYVADAQGRGYQAEVYQCAWGTAEELRGFFQSESANLVGCVLVGDIPCAWYEVQNDYGSMGYASFPCDYFLMDLDGVWHDDQQTSPMQAGVYDDLSGDEEPEIFVGRIDASRMGGDEATLTNAYFDKLHAYYSGALPDTDHALTYTDDDWVPYSYFWTHIANAYSSNEAIKAPNTDRDDYRDTRLTSTAYEFIQAAIHGTTTGHSFERGGWLSSSAVKAVPPRALFYNLFSCSNCRFTGTGCLGLSYLFNDSTTSLAAVGSTKTGGMLSFSSFYRPLGEGKTMGQSLREWLAFIAPFEPHDVYWHLGMVLLGDPLVAPRVQINPVLEVAATPRRSDYHEGETVELDIEVRLGGVLVDVDSLQVGRAPGDAPSVLDHVGVGTWYCHDALQPLGVGQTVYTVTATDTQHGTATASVTFDIEPDHEPPIEITSVEATPTPFAPGLQQVDLAYEISKDAVVTVRVLDEAGGAVVRTVLYRGQKTEGAQALAWDGLDDGGAPVADGSYVFHIQAVHVGDLVTVGQFGGSAHLSDPRGVAHHGGRVFVADAGTPAKVVVYDTSGNFVAERELEGWRPVDVDVDDDGRPFVLDDHATQPGVVVLTAAPEVAYSTEFARGTLPPDSVASPCIDVNPARDRVYAGTGKMYNEAVHLFERDGSLVGSFTVSPWKTCPTGAACDDAGALWIATRTGSIRRYDDAGSQSLDVALLDAGESDVGFRSPGLLYAKDQTDVIVFDVDLTPGPGHPTLVEIGRNGDAAATQTEWNGIAVDDGGTVFALGGNGTLFITRLADDSSKAVATSSAVVAVHAPSAPSDLEHSANTTTSITWTWQDHAVDEDGFLAHDAQHAERWSASADATSHAEQPLAPNTRYTRHLHAWRADVGLGAPSADASAYTSIEPSSGVLLSAVTTTSIAVQSASIPSNLASGGSGLILRNATAATDSGWQQSNAPWVSASLSPNMPYAFHAQSRNGDGDLTPESPAAMAWTLPATPAVTCDQPVSPPVHPQGTTFTFTNTTGWGPGALDHCRVVWDQSTSTVPGPANTAWQDGELVFADPAPGRWYLHVAPYNGDGAAGEIVHLGPYEIESLVPPPGNMLVETRILAGGRLVVDAPACGSLCILEIEPNGGAGTELAVHLVGGGIDAWVRIDANGHAWADAATPQWYGPADWVHVRLRGLAPATPYTFHAQARIGGQESPVVEVGTATTSRAGDVNGSGTPTALDYAYIRAALLNGGVPGLTCSWACDLDDSATLTGNDLNLARDATLNPQ